MRLYRSVLSVGMSSALVLAGVVGVAAPVAAAPNRAAAVGRPAAAQSSAPSATPAPAPVASSPAVSSSAGPAPAGDPVSVALAAAKSSGQDQVVDALTSATSQTTAHPDGRQTVQLSTRPVRWHDPVRGWLPLDLRLTVGGGSSGLLSAASADPTGPGSGQISNSATGTLVSLPTAAGTLGLSHPDALGSAAAVSGSTADFANALPGGRGLHETLLTGGVEEAVSLPAAGLPASYLVAVSLPAGVSAAQTPDGVVFATAAGPVAGLSNGVAHDSTRLPSGDGVETRVHSTLLGVNAGVATISVSVDPGWLASPARVFPVLIDPTFYANTAQAGRFDAYVDSAYPNETEGTYDPGVLKLGTYNGGGEVGRVLMYFNTAGSLPAGAQVSDAYVAINNNYSFSCPNGSTPSVGLYGLGAGWSDQSVTWNNQPPGDGQPASSATVFAKGYDSGCPGGYVNLPATSLAQRWANGQADRGVQLGTVENNSYGWKKFYPGEAGSAAAPAMYITYSTDCTFYPQTGHSVCGAIRDRYDALGGPGGFLGYPSVDAVLNPDGVGLRQQFQGAGGAWIYQGPNSGAHEIGGGIYTRWGAQSYERGPLGYPTSDERAAFTSFNGSGDRQNDFEHGSIYWNHLGGITNNQTSPDLLMGDKAFFNTDTVKLTDRLTAKINRGTGNLALNLTGLTAPGIGADRPVGLTYQSLSQAPGSTAAGSALINRTGGWRTSDSPDVRIAVSPGHVDYTDSSFALWRFTGNGPWTGPAGLDADLTKNGDGTYTMKIHGSGRTLNFDSYGMLIKDADRNGNAVSFPPGRYPSVITGSRGAGDGRSVQLSFNGPSGKLGELCQSLTATNCTGTATRSDTTLVVDYGYDGAGNLASVTDPNGNATRFGYDSGNPDPGMRQDLLTVTDPNGNVTRFTYDSLHRITDLSRDDNGIKATSTYDYIAADRHTHEFAPTHPHTSGVFTDYGIDAGGKVTDVTDPKGNHSSTAWTADNQVASGTNATGGTSTNSFTQPTNAPAGAHGPESLQTSQQPMGASGSATYTNPAGPSLYAPTTSTDSMKNTSSYAYDGAGNLGSATNASAAVAAVGHNTPGDGTVSSSTDPNNAGKGLDSVYGYDQSTHNLTSITPPASGTNLRRTFGYDGFGRTASSGTRMLTTTYGYDRMGRVLSQTHSDSSPALSASYDPNGNTLSTGDGTGTVTNTYDHLNRLTGATRVGAPSGTTSYGYDPAGSLTSLTDGRGTSSYHYDKAGELDQINESGGNIDIFGYNPDHKRVDSFYDTAGTNGGGATYDGSGNVLQAPTGFAVHTRSSLDAGGRLTETKTSRASNDGTVAADLSYCYRPYVSGQGCPVVKNGTDTDKRQYQTDNLTQARTDYHYDKGGRLSSAVTTGGPNTTYSYCFDADGNRTYESTATVDCTQVGPGKPITPTHSFNSVNQLTTDGAAFDADGNQTAPAPLTAGSYNSADQTTSFTPNGQGQTSASYAGNGQAQRLTLGSTSFANGIPGLLSETTGGASTFYERDPAGTLIAQRGTTGEFYYYLDGLGSVLGLIDTTGNVQATYSYDPYGATTNIGGPNSNLANTNPYRYASGYLDTATGLYQFGQRYYQPTLGRWTQQDTLNVIGDPANGNRYTYTGDDPINNVDPTGQSCIGVDFFVVDAGYCSDSNYGGSGFYGGVGVGVKAGVDFYAGAPTSGFTDSCALVGGVGAVVSGSPSQGYAGSPALGLDAGCAVDYNFGG